LFATTAGQAQSTEAPALRTEISPQSLADALNDFTHQTGLQIVYVSEIVRDQHSQGAPAGLAPPAALNRLLAGTGLVFEFLNARTVRIAVSKPAVAHSHNEAAKPMPAAAREQQEIVVSAHAFNELASHAPVSVLVWTQDEMAVAGIKDIATLSNLTPGVEFDSYSDYGAGYETNVAIRGIDAKDGSTAAILLDDVPLVSERLSSFGRPFPLTFDLDQVEVLRGPQGVLMGEGAEGGGVRFITAQPNLKTFTGLARGEYSITERGAPSYEAGAAVSGPLVRDNLGFHLSAWYRRDGGYVDRVDPFTGATVDADANWTKRSAVIGAMTFAPNESLEITPSFLEQRLYTHDTSAFYTYLSDPEDGILKNGKLLGQPYSDYLSLLSLRIAAEVNGIQLKSTTTYMRRHSTTVFDNTNNWFWFWPNPLGFEYPVSYADAKPTPFLLNQKTLSTQVVLTKADPRARVGWVFGAQFIHAQYREIDAAANSALADGGWINGFSNVHRHTSQTAAYGMLNLRLQPRLTATVGARVERASYESQEGVGIDNVSQWFDIEGASTPVALHSALAFQADDRNLYYATIAKAYRVGGPNENVGMFCSPTPTSYDPDFLWSLELGAKNQTSNGRLQLNTSVFRMFWHNIQTQVPVPSCGFGYTTNGGEATSTGFDLGVRVAATNRLTLELTAAYADARYTKTMYSEVTGVPQVIVTKGDVVGTLPLVPAPLTAVASVEYQMTISSAAIAKLRAQDVFHSHNPGPFTTDNPDAIVYAPERQSDPATHQVNLIATASWSLFDLSLFVNNVLDTQPVLQRRNRIPGDTLFYATTFRPRTVGLTANWRFGKSGFE
jgi:outer membrane receptor protein involved in Fe transport